MLAKRPALPSSIRRDLMLACSLAGIEKESRTTFSLFCFFPRSASSPFYLASVFFAEVVGAADAAAGFAVAAVLRGGFLAGAGVGLLSGAASTLGAGSVTLVLAAFVPGFSLAFAVTFAGAFAALAGMERRSLGAKKEVPNSSFLEAGLDSSRTSESMTIMLVIPLCQDTYYCARPWPMSDG